MEQLIKENVDKHASLIHNAAWQIVEENHFSLLRHLIARFMVFDLTMIVTNNGNIPYNEMEPTIQEIASKEEYNHVHRDHLMVRWLISKAVILSGKKFEYEKLCSMEIRTHAANVLINCSEAEIRDLLWNAGYEKADLTLMKKLLGRDEKLVIKQAQEIFLKKRRISTQQPTSSGEHHQSFATA